MLYSEIYAACTELTKRPDLSAETQRAIQAATLRAHQSDYFTRDIAETLLILATADYSQTFNVQTALTRFRNFKYIRKYDPTALNTNTGLATGEAGELFEILDPVDIFDSYSLQKENVAYLAGDIVNLRSMTGTFDQLLVGWYQNPSISPLNDVDYNSWIARDSPFAIIYDACSIVFKTIGWDTEQKKYDMLTAEQFAILKIYATTAIGG